MIEVFIKAWDENNKLLLKEFEQNRPSCYQDIVEKLVKIVINPYLKDKECKYPLDEGLNIDNITIIDNGDYQGTTIYIIPCSSYQPSINHYVFTHNEYGSCGGSDTFKGIESDFSLWDDKNADKIGAAKEFYTLALHLLQKFKFLNE